MSEYHRGYKAGLETARELAIKWRDENRASAAKMRKRSSYDDCTAQMLEGAATECHALAGEILRLSEIGS